MTIEELRQFALAQGNRVYNYGSVWNCALAQFLTAQGFEFYSVGGYRVSIAGGDLEINEKVRDALGPENPYSNEVIPFSTLAKRLEGLTGPVLI